MNTSNLQRIAAEFDGLLAGANGKHVAIFKHQNITLARFEAADEAAALLITRAINFAAAMKTQLQQL